ncbi:uncharacterized protein UV8b_16027 [Ustilaginoidea virens]|uniref:Cytochrome P450 n=1 Tax=Ustilaginoidea virens TaxID=1159556 RepID=A0A0A1VAM4_USTVR|nr:uncharacterized protein UV8b_16027 [Ustilaginoidea virens]QUC21787.1 hypothetical protein UV8b_16027 [Ustilaginoidea virens]GAO17428.1 hypothetical protein UVI_02052300 [Ustilaginoidea virens]FAA01157.1 TPA: cytochrome P450 [Ustilaginoidea virens]
MFYTLLLVLVCLFFLIYRRWLHPLSHFPGPFFASISGLYQTYWNFQPNFQDNFVKLHEEYGPVVRYSPNGLIFENPQFLHVAYGRRADKSDFFAPNFDTHSTFTRKYHEEHVASKKAIATAYSHLNLQLFESRINNLLLQWLGKLNISTREKGRTDFLEYASWFTADATSQLVSGKPIGFIEAEKDVRNLLYHNNKSFAWISFLSIQDNFSWYVRNTRLGRYALMARPTDKTGIGVFMRERDSIVDSIVDASGKIDRETLVEGSLLWSFLNAEHQGSISMTDVRAEVLFALLAGSSVTPSNLWSIVFLISRDQSIKDRLYHELCHAEETGLIYPTSIVSEGQVKKLPYLCACIQEGLRYTPTISQLPRLSPRKTGLVLDGKYVPPGFSVSTSPWVIGRSKDLYGEDSSIFRPERWLEASPGQLRKWQRYSFHFGYGARKCLAKNFAHLQLQKAIAEIFRRFDVQVEGSAQGNSAGKPTTRNFRFLSRK